MSAGPDRRPDWLRWAQRVQAIAQTGLTYASDPYDRERYEELRGIAVAMAHGALAVPAEEVRVAFASGLGYPTPKVDVRAVVFRGEELLLVRERRSGRWTFPGGWADVGDTPSLAAERETLEESGYRVKAGKVLGAARQVAPRAPALDRLYIQSTDRLPSSRAASRSPATRSTPWASSPATRGPTLDLDRTTPGQVELAWAHLADPSRPTDFD